MAYHIDIANCRLQNCQKTDTNYTGYILVYVYNNTKSVQMSLKSCNSSASVFLLKQKYE